MNRRPTFEDLAGGNARTWRAARLWAQVDPTVAETVANVEASYAALATLVDDGNADDRADDWGTHPTRTPAATMNDLIRGEAR